MNRSQIYREVTGWVKWFLPFYLLVFLPLGASAQDDKAIMFNPVEHAVISQTIAPDARGAGMVMWVSPPILM